MLYHNWGDFISIDSYIFSKANWIDFSIYKIRSILIKIILIKYYLWIKIDQLEIINTNQEKYKKFWVYDFKFTKLQKFLKWLYLQKDI